MKKTIRKLMAVLLSMCMMLSLLSVSAFAATKDDVTSYNNYLALGDSITAGYNLEDWGTQDETGAYISGMKSEAPTVTINGKEFVDYRQRVEGAYPALIADAVKAENFQQYAQCAFRTVEMRMLLDENYQGDGMTDLLVLTQATFDTEILNAERQQYIDAVKNADLITLDIGVNDIWVPVLITVMLRLLAQSAEQPETTAETVERVESALSDDATAAEVEALQQDLVLAEELVEEETGEPVVDENGALNADTLAALAGLLKGSAELLSDVLKLVAKCEVSYRLNYAYIIERIFELNPTATVVCPMYVADYDAIPLIGGVLKIALTEMNLYTMARPNHSGHLLYVSSSNLGVEDFSDGFGHPNEAGQEKMATSILNVLPTADQVKGTTVKQGADGNWYSYTDGVYDQTVNSVVNNALGWWKVENGKVNFKFNGIATNKNGAWYLLGGKVQFLKTGYVRVDKNGNQVLFGGTRYKVVAGKVLDYKG